MINVKDLVTGETHRLDPTENTVVVKTRDGFKVKIHPAALRSLVKVGDKFEGTTITGTRQMERLKDV